VSRPVLGSGRVGVAGLMAPVALLALLLGTATGAAPNRRPVSWVDRAPSDARALELLERASQAPATIAYHGVQFVSAWSERGSTSLVVEVDHRPGHGTTVHTGATTQNPAADTFLPADDTEPSAISGGTALQRLASNYTIVLAGRRSVSGRPADLVEARWPDSERPAARFWLDASTGLVLRREVYDEAGRTTRASAFVEIVIGTPSSTQAPPPRAMAQAWSETVDYSDRAAMTSRGWHCPDKLPGALDLVDARRGGDADAPILHLSYSDGLATVSLFEQRGRLDAENLDGYRREEQDGRAVYVRDGMPQRVVWSARGTVFTLVADAPPSTVEEVVAALPHDPVEASGTWHRLGRGFERVASWFNPFG
jgi:sigma-E factor negative regulatory protein RseB